jgi:zinc protease
MLVALLLGMMLAPASPDAAADPVIPHRRYRLENGLDVVLHDDDSYPLIAVRVVYHVGSMHDPADKRGVAHLLEHAMFGGSDHVADGEFWSYLARAGGDGINAETRSAATIYVESIPANQLELALWLESDRMGFFRMGLARTTIEKERAIVVQEFKQRRRGSDEGIAMSGMADILFPAGHPRHGEDARSLARIAFSDVAAMRREHYGPNNATLVLSGSLPDDVDALVEQYFGTLRGGLRPARPPVPRDAAARSDGQLRMSQLRMSLVRTPTRFLGWRTSPLYAPGDADADVVAQLLLAWGTVAEPAVGSRVASLSAFQVSDVAGSMFVVRLGGHVDADPAAMSAELDAVLRRIAAGDVSDDELLSAQRRCELRVFRRLGSIEERADLMVDYVIAGKPADWVEQDVRRYRDTTRATVARFVQTQLLAHAPVVTTLLPSPPSPKGPR